MYDLNKLMVEQLRDAYSAEKQALQLHAEQTKTQVERLEQALEMLGGKAGRKVCEGMRGILEEAQQEIEDQEKGPVFDMLVVAGVQRVEHYEIAACGTMVALAKAAGQTKLADLLADTLAEEKQTDETLSRLAESEVNPAAIEGMQQAEPANDRKGKRGAA